MKLAIVTAATKSYLYAWEACVRSIASAAAHHDSCDFVFCTDKSDEAKNALETLKRELPNRWKIHTIALDIGEDTKSYESAPQLRIAALQGAGFAYARNQLKVDRVLSVESDNILPGNALRVLEWGLEMPQADGSGYYDVMAATYINGGFLGGFGSPTQWIYEDFTPEERMMKPRLKLCFDACSKRLQEASDEKELKRIKRLVTKVKGCPPSGTLWDMIGKHGWRQRGWFQLAYPGIGEGCLVPTPWVGLGCTLMSKKALALADFNGYIGQGTQDLFLCWERWEPAGIRRGTCPHVICGHVKKSGDKITNHIGYHDLEPKTRGHLKMKAVPWVGHLPL